jgi:hypothetical protein
MLKKTFSKKSCQRFGIKKKFDALFGIKLKIEKKKNRNIIIKVRTMLSNIKKIVSKRKLIFI